MDLNQRTVIITGATSGIGLALTQRLTATGCRVVAVARSAEKLAQLESRIAGIIPLRCNLAIKADVLALGQQLAALSLAPSVLINNAAVQFTSKFTDADFSFDGIEVEVTTNFTAVAWLTSLMLPILMQSRDGAAVVNVSSGLAIHPKTSSAVYCASKAALHSLSQSLRYQLHDTGVGVTEIILPMVETPMTEGRSGTKITPERVADEIVAAIRLRRDELYIGKARLLPLLSRLSPSLTKRILKAA